jgi:hypothetical protein
VENTLECIKTPILFSTTLALFNQQEHKIAQSTYEAGCFQVEGLRFFGSISCRNLEGVVAIVCPIFFLDVAIDKVKYCIALVMAT